MDVPGIIQQHSHVPVIQWLDSFRNYVISKLALFFLLYLSTFVIFAVIRVVTGVSIKRLGFLSLRQISYSPLPYLSINIGSLRLSPHRPTFSNPSWLSLVIKDFEVIYNIDKAVKSQSTTSKAKPKHKKSSHKHQKPQLNVESTEDIDPVWYFAPSESMLFYVVRFILNNVRFFELTLKNATFTIKDLMALNIGNSSFKVDLRKTASATDSNKFDGTLDRYKFKDGEVPAVIQVACLDAVLLTPNDPTPMSQDEFFLQTEFFNVFTFKVLGVIDLSNLALKDLAVDLKLGTLNLHIDRMRDHIQNMAVAYQASREKYSVKDPKIPSSDKNVPSLTPFHDTTDTTDSNHEQTEDDVPSDDQKLRVPIKSEDVSTITRIGTILVRIVKEVDIKLEQINVNHFTLNPHDDNSKIKMAAAAKNMLLDIRRLNPRSPAFRLFFSSNDSAHQAIFGCNSLSMAIYHNNTQEEIIYVPMFTAICKTNVFSKTIQLVKTANTDSNNSLLRATVTMSSPSINMESHHLPIFLDALKSSSHSPSSGTNKTHMDFTNSTFQKLWPRAVIKFTIDEPAARITITPPKQEVIESSKSSTPASDFTGMVVLNCSKIYADFISSHINDHGKQNYSFKSMIHTSALESFLQSNSGRRFDLVATESLSFKTAAILNPTLSVICTADIGSVKISALYDEVLESLKDVGHRAMRPDPTLEPSPPKHKRAFLREFPHWLSHFYCKISNIEFAVASSMTFNPKKRHPLLVGFEVNVSNFVIDYRSHVHQQQNLSVLHQRINKVFFAGSENDSFLHRIGDFWGEPQPQSATAHNNHTTDLTDDRNIAITFEGFQCYKLRDSKHVDIYPFLSVPRLSLSFFTGTDSNGPFMTTNFILRNAVVTWDLNLHYIIIISLYALKSIFPGSAPAKTAKSDLSVEKHHSVDYNAINVQTGVIIIKAMLPNDVHIMLETNNLQFAKRHNDYKRLTVSVIRFYTRHPSVPDAWSRLLVLKGLVILFKDHDTSPDAEDVLLEMRSFRVHIVNHLVVYRVLDNIVSNFKAILLLNDTLKTGVLAPGQVKLKDLMPKIPKVRIRSKALFMGIEDDTFEAKLGLIFRVGLRENKVRMEKEEQFEQKMKAILRGKQKPPAASQTDASAPSLVSQTTLQPSLPVTPSQHTQEHVGPRTINKQQQSQQQSKEPCSPLRNAYSPFSKADGQDAIGGFISEAKHEIDKIHAFPGSDNNFKTFNGLPLRSSTTSAMHRNRNSGEMHQFAGPKISKSLQKSATAIKNFHSQPSQILPHVKLRHKKNQENTKRDIINDSATDDGCCVSITAAREKLLENFSTSWIKAFNQAEENQRAAIREQTELSLGTAIIDPEMLARERIIEYSPYPFLFFIFVNNTDLLIRGPDFDEAGLRDFLFDVGKGLPKDTPFSMLIPLYLDLKASSFRVQTRDYPLPAFHFPELHPSQPRSTTSVSINGHFVLAEGYSNKESNIRNVDLPLVEGAQPGDDHFIAHVKRTVASVKMYTNLTFTSRSHFPTRITYCQAYQPAYQSAMQVFDTFSKPPIDPSEKLGFWDKIRSVFHARLTFNWKESDVHLLLKGSRSPYELLAESSGFAMVWRNNVVLTINKTDELKKLFTISSDDYLLAVPNYSLQEREYLIRSTTFQNGLVSPTNFNESTTFQKVVMKLSGQVMWYCGLLFEREIEKGTSLGRTFQFKPHYDIELNRPDCIKDLSTYDAYRGFRSEYLHMAISVVSLTHGDFDADNSSNYNSIHLTPIVFAHFHKWWKLFDNALSLPIRNGKMFNFDSLPQKSKKFGRHLFTVKYQLQLAPLFVTHSYLTSDFDAKTNSYSHHSTGLKAKIGNFSLDLHQRRSPNTDQNQNESAKRWRMNLNVGEMDLINTDLRVLQATFKERSHQESLAKKFGISSSPGSSISNGYSNTSSGTHFSGKIKISDNDYSWIDMDDFDELGETSPATIFPKISVSPLLYSPRWSYFRQTDHDDPHKFGTFIPFGNEDSHDCIIGQRQPQDSHKILINMRISELEEQLKTSETMLDSLTSDLERFPGVKETGDTIERVKLDIQQIKERLDIVNKISEKHHFVDEIDDSARLIAKNAEVARKIYSDASSMCAEKKDAAIAAAGAAIDAEIEAEKTGDTSSQIDIGLNTNPPSSSKTTQGIMAANLGRKIAEEVALEDSDPGARSSLYSMKENDFDTARISPVLSQNSLPQSDGPVHDVPQPEPEAYCDTESVGSARSMESLETIANPTGDSAFANRFIVHNLQLKWNNDLRNAVSHYLARVGDRRSNSYYITRRAVKYLEDLANNHANNARSSDVQEEQGPDIHAILREFNSDSAKEDPHFDGMLDDMNGNLADFDARLAATDGSFTADKKYLVRLTSPQIQLVSDVNPDSVVLVTSENIQLKIIEILDSDISEGDQSRLIESRYGVFLQDTQFYALSFEDVKSNAMLYFSHNTYGYSRSPMWPPWLAVECCYDENSLKEFLFVQRTSSTLRFDKPNSLRIQNHYNTKDLQDSCTAALIRHEMHHQNRMGVDFPKVVATTNSKQFYAAYTIVMDLILYSEPVKKQRSEQLDRVLLTTDFNDLKNAINRVVDLQKKIHRFDDIRVEFLSRMSEMNENSIRDLARVELLQENLYFELGVMIMAIKAGMQRGSDDSSQFFKWTIGADQIIWHILDSDNKPFVDMGLADASFNRIQGTDGFNSNSVEVGMMQAFNLEKDAVYPEMFSPFAGESGAEYDPNEGKLVSVNWTMLDPIGGIPIMQKFEVKVHPLKIQFERSTWDKVFEFIFPTDTDGEVANGLLIPHGKPKSEDPMFSDSSDSSDESKSDQVSVSTDPKKPYRSSLFHNKGALTASSIFSGRSSNSNRDRESVIRRDLGSAEKRNNSGTASPKGSIASSSNGTTNGSHNPLAIGRSNPVDDPDADDISLMMKRASNYIAIVDIRIDSTVLCVSHKGQGSRNILDIHEFVLNLPEIVYQNKTWSNMDLVLHLKKDITKILLTHTGALIGNKILKRHHRKQGQTKQLHQISNYVSFMSVDELAKDESKKDGRRGSLTPAVFGSPPSRTQTSYSRQDTLILESTSSGRVESLDSGEASKHSSHSASNASTSHSAISSIQSVIPQSLRDVGAKMNNHLERRTSHGSTHSAEDNDERNGKKRSILKRLLN